MDLDHAEGQRDTFTSAIVEANQPAEAETISHFKSRGRAWRYRLECRIDNTSPANDLSKKTGDDLLRAGVGQLTRIGDLLAVLVWQRSPCVVLC